MGVFLPAAKITVSGEGLVGLGFLIGVLSGLFLEWEGAFS